MLTNCTQLWTQKRDFLIAVNQGVQNLRESPFPQNTQVRNGPGKYSSPLQPKSDTLLLTRRKRWTP